MTHSARSPPIVYFMTALEPLLKSYLRDLRAQRRSDRTIAIYRYGVELFAAFLGGTTSDVLLQQLTRENLKAWVADRRDHWAPGTMRTHFNGVVRFSRWLVDEEYLDADPTAKVKLPEVGKSVAPEKIIKDEVLVELLALVNRRTFQDLRDTALLRVLLDTGVRASEVAGMTVTALDLDNATTVVVGKGSRSRAVYFSPKTVAALDRYVRSRASHKYAHHDELWLGQRGPWDGKSILDRVRAIGERAGVKLHPHMFRHTWAHDIQLNSDASAEDVKRLAGWNSNAMLARYGASGADVRAEAAARKAHRGDRV